VKDHVRHALFGGIIVKRDVCRDTQTVKAIRVGILDTNGK
jgi:hypothetical protein